MAECPQLKILRVEGSIYFGAVSHVGAHFDTLHEQYPQQKHLLLLSKSINFVDVAGAELLAREAERRRAMGGRLYFYGLRQPVADMLEHGGFSRQIGQDNIFDRRSEAISGAFARLDHSICARCRVRIFTECASVPLEGE